MSDNFELYAKNHELTLTSVPEARLNLMDSKPALLGLKVVDDLSGGIRFDLMIGYKGEVKIISPEEFSLSFFNYGYQSLDEKFDKRLFDDFANLDVPWAIEILKRLDGHQSANNNAARIWVYYAVLQSGASEESCRNSSPINMGKKFTEWCLSELANGDNQVRPKKDNIDWILKNTPELIPIDENYDLNNLADLWDRDIRVNIEGAFPYIFVSGNSK